MPNSLSSSQGLESASQSFGARREVRYTYNEYDLPTDLIESSAKASHLGKGFNTSPTVMQRDLLISQEDAGVIQHLRNGSRGRDRSFHFAPVPVGSGPEKRSISTAVHGGATTYH